jgi:putative hydrolase of the HAD superfamily
LTERAATDATMTAPVDVTPRALLLDFGSVISVSSFENHRKTERRLNLPAGSLTWLGPLNPDSDLPWAAMQRDEISEREYWALRARELGAAIGEPDWDMPTMLARLRHPDPNEVVRPQMRSLMRRARLAGIRVGMLSNEFELFHGAGMLERIDVLRELDAVVDATHTKILKPDPRAYQLALDALGVPAREVLFVDDQFRNIAGAIRAGLQAQFFDLRDVAGNIAAIEARLKLI